MSALPNARGAIDIAESIALELEDLGNAWIKVAEITSEEQAERAADLSAKILRAWQDNDKQRKTDEKPHRDAIKAMQDAWSPIQTKLTFVRGFIETRLSGWKQLKQQRLDAQRAAAKAAADKAAREAEEARKRAETPKTVGDVVRAEQAAQAAAEAAAAVAAIPQRAQVRGALSGRASSLRVHWSVTIVDLIEVFLRFKDHPDVRACLQRLAEAEVRAMSGDERAVEGCKVGRELR